MVTPINEEERKRTFRAYRFLKLSERETIEREHLSKAIV